MLTFDINLDSLNAELDQIATKAQKAARLGAKAGAAVYYDAVVASAPVSGRGHWFQGTAAKKAKGKAAKRSASYWFESGSLKGAVYQALRKESTKDNPTYQIAWNHRKVPYGFMVAYGTARGTKQNNFIAKGKASAASSAVSEMLSKFDQVMASK